MICSCTVHHDRMIHWRIHREWCTHVCVCVPRFPTHFYTFTQQNAKVQAVFSLQASSYSQYDVPDATVQRFLQCMSASGHHVPHLLLTPPGHHCEAKRSRNISSSENALISSSVTHLILLTFSSYTSVSVGQSVNESSRKRIKYILR